MADEPDPQDRREINQYVQQFVTECYGLTFQGLSAWQKDSEWKLTESEAGELGERTIRLTRSLDKKRAAELEKKFARYAPVISFLMLLLSLVLPRIAHTVAMRKELRAGGSGPRPPERPPEPARSTSVPVASNPPAPAPRVHVQEQGTVPGNGTGHGATAPAAPLTTSRPGVANGSHPAPHRGPGQDAPIRGANSASQFGEFDE